MSNKAKNPNETTDFFAEMSDVRRLKETNQVEHHSKRQQTLSQKLRREHIEKQVALDDNGLSIDYVEPVEPLDFITFKKSGVQEGVYKNLRLGKYAIDSRLTIKHLKLEDARIQLYQGIIEAHKGGIRTLLIDHGIGQNSKPFAGLLKSYANQWLKQIDAVIAFHTALKQHGGLGAVYVLLKKHPVKKAENREIHRKS